LRRSIEEEADSLAVSELFSTCHIFCPPKHKAATHPQRSFLHDSDIAGLLHRDYKVLQLARTVNSCVPCDFIQF
jgi:hypothetical protein